MSRCAAAASVLAAVFAFASVSRAAAEHDVYVWQRQWTPAVRAALAQSRDVFGGVRVLVAQAGRDGRWFPTNADPRDFAGDPRPRVAVVRYDGAGNPPDIEALEVILLDLLSRWHDGGGAFAGVEIDYDCGSKQLADYARRLRQLRQGLPPGITLSITALPSWMESAALDDLLTAADEAVLQVHAVSKPSLGLFDAEGAENWIRAFAKRDTKPFRIAVPAYGSRIVLDDAGKPLAVENEMPRDAAARADAHELHVEPAQVAALLRDLDSNPPPHWRGVVWFRLPIAGDRRAWTLDAIRDVVGGRVPEAALTSAVVARNNGASDVFIANDGAADANARALRVSAADCSASDATDGWHTEKWNSGWRFVPDAGLRVRADTRLAVGWVRCTRVEGAELE
jgi:hypothetical protein